MDSWHTSGNVTRQLTNAWDFKPLAWEREIHLECVCHAECGVTVEVCYRDVTDHRLLSKACHKVSFSEPPYCSGRTQLNSVKSLLAVPPPPVRRRPCQICVSSPVSAVHSVNEQFSRCLHNVVWMSASCLRLNANKTVLLWWHITNRFTVHKIQVLTSTVNIRRCHWHPADIDRPRRVSLSFGVLLSVTDTTHRCSHSQSMPLKPRL